MANSRTLAEKLGIKPDMPAYVLHAPAGYEKYLPIVVSLDSTAALRTKTAWLQAFYICRADLDREIDLLKASLAKNGQLWLCWPKRSSGVTTDLGETLVRTIGLTAGLVDVKIVAVNEVWSGLKFVYRLVDRTK